MTKLLSFLSQSFNPTFRFGDEGAGGGAAPAEDNSNLFDGLPIPDELRDDPELMADAKAFQDAKNKPEEPVTPEKKEPDAAAASKDASPQRDEKKGDAVNDKAGDEEVEYVFDSDVDIGDVKFSKDTLKVLPPDVLENLGKVKTSLGETAQRLADSEKKNQALLEDPIIAERMRLINEGKSNQSYVQIGVTRNTKDALSAELKSKGLTDEEITEVFEKVKQELEFDIDANVKAAVNNTLTVHKQEQVAAKTIEDGKQLVSKLASMNSDLTDEKVRNWCLDSKRRGTGPQGGLTYRDLIDLSDRIGVEGIYAAIARDHNLPFALNSKERDKQIVNNERQKLINALGGKAVAKAMRQAAAPASAAKQVPASIVNEGGVDKSKLNDPEYLDNLLANAKSDKEVFEIQNMIRSQR